MAGRPQQVQEWMKRARAGLVRFLGRPLWLAALAPLLAWPALFLAYQNTRPVVVDVGTSYARPYLEHFFEPERGPGFDYAYTTHHALLHLPGIGHSSALLQLRMGGGVPKVRQMLWAGSAPLAEVKAGSALHVYVLAVPAQASVGGSLNLSWEGETSTAPRDPRPLGIAVDRVTWIPLRGAIEPDWAQVLWVALAALGLYLLGRALEIHPLLAALASLSLVVLVALGIAWARLYLTIYTPRLAGLLLVLAGLLPLVRRATGRFLRRFGMEAAPGVEIWFWRITTLAAIIKLGGVLYPHLIVLDVGAHAYRVFRFLSGDADSLFLPNRYSRLGETVGLEGGLFPYSPLFHLLASPLSLLPIPLPLAMGLLNGIVDVVRNLPLYLLATRLSGRPQVGLWTALFYTLLPAPYYLLSWGNYPTQLGLFAALLAITFLVLHDERLGKWSTLPGWLGAVLLVLFSYTVVGVLAGAMIVLLCPLEPLLSPRPKQARRAGVILGGLLLGEGIAFVLYHSTFVEPFCSETLPAILQAVAAKGSGLGSLLADPRESLLSNWVANGIFARNHLTDLGLVFAAVGVLGLLLEAGRRRWRSLLTAWLLVFPLFALVSGLVADLVLKHVLFMLPLFCLGAGFLAGLLWRRSWAGRATTILFALLLGGLSLARWPEYILVKRH